MAKSKLKSELLVLCDLAMVSKEGKLSIIGIFDRMFVTNLPSKFSRFFVVSLLQGEPESEHKINVNIVSPSGEKIMDGKVLDLKLGTNGKTNAYIDVSNFPLPETGEYKIQIVSGGSKITESIFNVTRVNTKSGTESQNLPN